MKLFALLLIALLLPLIGRADETVLVRGADGSVVTTVDIEADAERIPPEARRQLFGSTENVNRMADNILVRRVLAKEAEAAGMEKDHLLAARLRLARERVLSDARVQQHDGPAPDLGLVEKRALAEYKANPERYRITEEIRVSHILIGKQRTDGRKLIEDLLGRLKNGEAQFGQLALQFSDDPGSKAKGGDLGFVERGRMVKPFEDAAFSLDKPGDLSGIVETQFGWHIIRLEEKRSAGMKPFDEVKAELSQKVIRGLLDARRAPLIEPIREKATFDTEAIKAFSASFL